ncbi:MAG: hypothetical protein KBT03_09600 [Bacteroidales bacterium]|nr:hypothetical protein [Candidatus Scybalousia scybalohippi]
MKKLLMLSIAVIMFCGKALSNTVAEYRAMGYTLSQAKTLHSMDSHTENPFNAWLAYKAKNLNNIQDVKNRFANNMTITCGSNTECWWDCENNSCVKCPISTKPQCQIDDPLLLPNGCTCLCSGPNVEEKDGYCREKQTPLTPTEKAALMIEISNAILQVEATRSPTDGNNLTLPDVLDGLLPEDSCWIGSFAGNSNSVYIGGCSTDVMNSIKSIVGTTRWKQGEEAICGNMVITGTASEIANRRCLDCSNPAKTICSLYENSQVIN